MLRPKCECDSQRDSLASTIGLATSRNKWSKGKSGPKLKQHDKPRCFPTKPPLEKPLSSAALRGPCPTQSTGIIHHGHRDHSNVVGCRTYSIIGHNPPSSYPRVWSLGLFSFRMAPLWPKQYNHPIFESRCLLVV